MPSVPLTGGSAPCTPQATPPLLPRSRTASVQTSRHAYSQRSIPCRRPTHTLTIKDAHMRPHLPNTDEADEEVRQINSSVQRKDSSQQVRRSHTLSPYVTAPSCSDSQPQNSQQTDSGAHQQASKGSNLRKFYSVDAHGLLTQPACTRRHSTHGEELQQPAAEQHRPSCQMRGRSVSPVPRKEKMSPPCISIDPPTDSEIQSPPTPSQESSTLLRRRAPSFESALTQESLDLPDTPPLTTPLPPTEPHLEPHSEPHLPSHLPLPQFSFDQSDVSSLSSLSELLSDSDQSSHSFPLEAQPEAAGTVEGGAAPSAFRKREPVSSRDSANPDSVA